MFFAVQLAVQPVGDVWCGICITVPYSAIEWFHNVTQIEVGEPLSRSNPRRHCCLSGFTPKPGRTAVLGVPLGCL